MYIKRVNKLIAYLESIPDNAFNMQSWCGTACCIAGHAAILAKGKLPKEDWQARSIAKKYLGLEDLEADDLFHALSWAKATPLRQITKQEAIDHMKRLVTFEEARNRALLVKFVEENAKFRLKTL